jgi:CHAD domain-containing protein
VTSLNWDGSKPVAENARQNLPELARRFFAAGREADSSFAALHRFRLVTKRFRYTLEMFRPYYDSELERRIEGLQALQQILGEISDVSATRELLAGRDDLPPSERRRLLRKLSALATARRAVFRRHWGKEFSTPAQVRSWMGYLRRV